MQLIERVLPEITIEKVTQAFRFVQPTLWQMGLTGVHDYDQRRCFAALLASIPEELRWRVIKGFAG
jgi:predicted amidohydrolase YtcJ